MSIDLPRPIEIYLRAENSGDVTLLAECFLPDATVRDERHLHSGLAAIQDWKAETKRKYRHTVEPLALSRRDGETILAAKVAGDFPGSPVTLDFRFTLEGEKIKALEIG